MKQLRTFSPVFFFSAFFFLFTGAGDEAAIAKKKAADDYKKCYAGTRMTDLGCTGNVKTCTPGKLSDVAYVNLLTRINYFRRLAGLSPVKLDTFWNSRAQAAALIMSANGKLTHAPGTDMHCYSANGSAGAKSSNLSMGYSSIGFIDGQIADATPGNESCGHRRWLLYSGAHKMGVGFVSGAGTVHVLPPNDRKDTSRFHGEVPAYFGYPFRGYIPFNLVFKRWTFSLPGGGDFKNATVKITAGKKMIPSVIISRNGSAGDPSLVWSVDEPMVKFIDQEITVKVDSVKVGAYMRSYTYSFTPFDPGTVE